MKNKKEDMHAKMARLRAMRKNHGVAKTSTPDQVNGMIGGNTSYATKQMKKLGMDYHGSC